jgi:hypothetical protein
MSALNVATLRLFNAIQLDQIHNQEPFDFGLFSSMIRNGYMLDERIVPSIGILLDIEHVVGVGGEKLNSSFHKSWDKVANAPIFQLLMEQIFHYITTYGYGSLGIYDNGLVYIPAEKLELPDVYDDIPLVFIRGMNPDEILAEIIALGSSGIALSKTTIEDIMVIVRENEYESGWVSEIENRELRSALFNHYGIVPSEPVSWLRYVITALTGETLVIKNRNLMSKIQTCDGDQLDNLLDSAPEDLASIFLRYKPLFLAMKKASKNKKWFFNRLRKQATTMHFPLPEDYMGSVTQKIKKGELAIAEFKKNLSTASVWRKIRLAYALKNRLTNTSSVVYRVRNGKGFVASAEPSQKLRAIEKVLNLTLESVASDISNKVAEKYFYIPSWINYGLPRTEKSFIGNIPDNTYVTLPSTNDLVVGVHWYNNGDRYEDTVDIDFSMVGVDTKYGWDARYRSDDKEVLYSGDMTTAPRPNGASEMFYVSDYDLGDSLLMVNWYNMGYGEMSVENCSLFVAQEPVNKKKFGTEGRNGTQYMVDPNNVLFSQNITIDKKQNTIGLVTKNNGAVNVHFLMTSVGNAISSSSSVYNDMTREFLIATTKSPLGLRDIIELAGGHVIDETTELDSSDNTEVVDLRPEALSKTTFIDLFS